ncbi:unnamed protein product [Medioppia subpectinata]|uniref:BTB domain-containing protein n=1 Tax=Medioppia subpectinata TaxID=1979941 RepID=A0A7R9KAN0_9ACAR|nr:unnamed protein product [Medioppia subpectinata]CAG2099967.1 unnamed protein product [Medioppia subpectinata]
MAQEMTSTKTSLVTADDTEDEDIQQIFAKNSFDRFGDDLCELILSYLSLDERFDCECVSNQFQRTVFGSVVDITLTESSASSRTSVTDMKMLATIGRKCPHIHTIDCRGISIAYTKQLPEALAIFRDNCPHLRHIYCNLDTNTNQLMPEFGPLVTRIGDIGLINIKSLSHCHRLSRVRISSLHRVFDGITDQLLAKNLHSIELSIYSHHNHLLGPFVAENAGLKSVRLGFITHNTHEILTEMAAHLSRLPQLRELALDLNLIDGQNSLNESLRTIGQKCPHLKRFALTLRSADRKLNGHTIEAMRYYRRLKCLRLILDVAIDGVFLDPLKHCHRLRQLTLTLATRHGLGDSFPDNCGYYWPRLQYIYIKTNDISHESLIRISRLPALKTLVLECESGFLATLLYVGNHLFNNLCEDLLSRSAKLVSIEIQMTPTKTSLVTADDIADEDIQQPQIYAKNSMDRFGDDLCGLILSYLSFNERFAYECVSKQFQRTVFASVVHIYIEDKYCRKPGTKCSDSTTLTTICRKCPNIDTINWISRLSDVFDDNSGQLLAKNLRAIEVTYDSDVYKLLSALVADNQRLNTVIFNAISFESHATVVQIGAQLSRLTQLRDLTLKLCLTEGHNSLDACLRPIGQKCPQLKRLGLILDSNYGKLNGHSLDSLRWYRRLQCLRIIFFKDIDDLFLDPLRHCHTLTHLTLTINSYEPLGDILPEHWPPLQFLCIHTYVITRECLDQISGLPALKTLELHSTRLIGFTVNESLIGNHCIDNVCDDLMARNGRLKTIKMTQTKTSLVTADDTEDEDIQQPQIYAKNSMDRFGDDLCGLILSYLSLDERFDCECVSKQFQRTVFESVVDITLHDSSRVKRSRTDINDMKMLATIGRKCPHIHTIDCRRISNRFTKQLPEVLAIFRDNLRHIYCNLDTNTGELMPEFGQLVTRIGNILANERQSLTHCHRLSRLRVHQLCDVFDKNTDELLAKNLKRFVFSYNNSNNNEQLTAFVAQNQSLRSVKLTDNRYPSHESLKEMAEQLSRLPQLRDLELDLKPTKGQNSLNESLRTIGQKCSQLKRLALELNFTEKSALKDHSLESLTTYQRLKRLELTLFVAIDDVFLDPLKLCHRLTHLTLNSWSMSDKLFVNCDKQWPRLQRLFIRTEDITRELMDHISTLPALQTLVFGSFRVNGIKAESHDLIDNVCEDLLSKNPKLKTIEIFANKVSKFYCQMGQCISFTSTSDDENDNNEDLEQPMIYAKNSFDRFGDDLFGLIVSYLTLDERLDYECVSKQFQRTAFDSVFEITIHDKKATKSRISVYNREMLATIDRKCPNIHTIDCRGIRSTCLMEFVEMLTIFVSNLNRNLRYIYCNYDLNVYHLLPSLGRLITRIGDISLNQNQMLIHCRVSCLRVQRLSDVFDNTSGQLLAKNLRRIELFRNPTDDMQQLSAFVAENQSLKSFKVFYNNYFYSNVSHETIIEMAEQLSRLPQLRELGLNVQLMIGQNSLNEFLRTIGQKCPQLQNTSDDEYDDSEDLEQPQMDAKTPVVITDDSEEHNVIKQPKIYSKNSFDRFGDDLCGLILSYLSLDTRLDCECVSQQFQRTVFESVVDIEIHDKYSQESRIRVSNSELLAKIGRKCPNIQTFDFRRIESRCVTQMAEVLRIFRYHFRDIYCNIDGNVHQLLQQFGPLVTRVGSVSEERKQWLRRCGRLSRLRAESLFTVFGDRHNRLLATNLQRFEIFDYFEDHEELSAFVAGNQSLRSVRLNFIDCNTDESLTQMADQLSRLPQLRDLTLTLELTDGQISLNDSLGTIGQNCRQLKRLKLKLIANESPLIGRKLESLKFLSRLRRLYLQLSVSEAIDDVLLEPLKLCHRLTHLSIKSSQMNDTFLDNCDKHWPRLQYLYIRPKNITREGLDAIARLPALQILVFKCVKLMGRVIKLKTGDLSFMGDVCEEVLSKNQLIGKMTGNARNGSQDTGNQTSIDFERYPAMYYYRNESESGVHFIVNGQRVPTLRALLKTKSPVFREMLARNKAVVNDIAANENTVDAINTMIGFMLTSSLILTNANDLKLIGDVLEFAHNYRVTRLVDAIGKHLETLITVETIETIAKIADKYGMHGLYATIISRLFEMLAVDNVLTLARVAFTYAQPTRSVVCRFRAALKTMFDQIMARESHDLVYLNAITNNLWLEVSNEVLKEKSKKSDENMAQEMTQMKTSLVITDDTEDIQQPQIFAKNSFDRFGDDLCGLILSYLSFDDRFVCECVSKQFQRTVFESVVDITLREIMRKKITENLVTIDRKCPHIHTIGSQRMTINEFQRYQDNRQLCPFAGDNQSLRSTKSANICESHESLVKTTEQLSRLPQLRDLKLDLSLNYGQNSLNESLRTIGQKCPQLKRLALILRSKTTVRLYHHSLDSLISYQRLRRFDLKLCVEINDTFLDPLKLCHRLTHLTLHSCQLSDKWFINCDKQWQRLQYLNIRTENITREGLDHISRLPALQTLVFECRHFIGYQMTANLIGTHFMDNVCEHLLAGSAKLKTIEIRRFNVKRESVIKVPEEWFIDSSDNTNDNSLDSNSHESQESAIISVFKQMTDSYGLNQLECNRIRDLMTASKIYEYSLNTRIRKITDHNEYIRVTDRRSEWQIQYLIDFTQKLRSFSDNICFEDQLSLVKYGWFDVNTIRSIVFYDTRSECFGINLVSGYLYLKDLISLQRVSQQFSRCSQQVLQKKTEVSVGFNDLKADSSLRHFKRNFKVKDWNRIDITPAISFIGINLVLNHNRNQNMESIVRQFRDVKKLYLSTTVISFKTLELIVNQWPHLEELLVYNIDIYDSSDKTITEWTQLLIKVKYITIGVLTNCLSANIQSLEIGLTSADSQAMDVITNGQIYAANGVLKDTIALWPKVFTESVVKCGQNVAKCPQIECRSHVLLLGVFEWIRINGHIERHILELFASVDQLSIAAGNEDMIDDYIHFIVFTLENRRRVFRLDLWAYLIRDLIRRMAAMDIPMNGCQFIRNSDELEKRKQLIGDNKRKRDKTQPSVVSSTTETSIVSSSEISSSDENTKINEFLTQLLDNTFDVNEDELIREITDIENSFKNNVMDILDQLSRKITITPMYRKLVDYNGLRELEITRINELLRAAHIYTIPDGFETQMKDYKIHRIGNQSELLECVVKVTEISINALMSYVNGLPAFAEVCSEDQLALVKYGLSEFNSIRSLKYLHNNDIYTTLKNLKHS